MFYSVHPAANMLRGDGNGYNPRDLTVAPLTGSYDLLTGVFRDDGVGSSDRPDRPFHIVIPKGFQAWHSLNTDIFSLLRTGVPEIRISIGDAISITERTMECSVEIGGNRQKFCSAHKVPLVEHCPANPIATGGSYPDLENVWFCPNSGTIFDLAPIQKSAAPVSDF